VHARSTKPESAIVDLDDLRPPSRRDATAVRERNEAAAFQKTDMRKPRKNRNVMVSFRIKPEIRAIMERIADAENITLVEVLERGISMLDRTMKGNHP
jgi:hypothetical protein